MPCPKDCKKRCCPKQKDCVEFTKRVLFTSTEFPTVYEEKEIDYDSDDDVEIETERSVRSNMSFAYSVTITNNNDCDIRLKSLVDPLLTVGNQCRGGSCCYINFRKPRFSDCRADLNCRWKKTGELLKCSYRLRKGQTVVCTISGCINSKSLSVCNFAYLKYKKCSCDGDCECKHYTIESNTECLKMENDECCKSDNHSSGGVVVNNDVVNVNDNDTNVLAVPIAVNVNDSLNNIP